MGVVYALYSVDLIVTFIRNLYGLVLAFIDPQSLLVPDGWIVFFSLTASSLNRLRDFVLNFYIFEAKSICI